MEIEIGWSWILAGIYAIVKYAELINWSWWWILLAIPFGGVLNTLIKKIRNQ